MKRKIVCIGLCLLMILGVFGSFSKDLDEMQDKLEDTNSKISDLTNQKRKVLAETKSVKNELTTLDNRLNTAAEDIDSLNDEIAGIKNEKEAVEAELKKCEHNLAMQQMYFEERVRSMYKNKGISYLEVLLSSKNLMDFASRLEMVKKIADSDQILIASMKETRTAILAHQEALNKSELLFEATKNQLEVKKEELLVATREKQSHMKTLSQKVSEANKQLSELKKQSEAFRKEIVKLQSSEKYSGGDLIWPVLGHTRISSPYGMRLHPITKVRKLHTGIDIPAPSGTAISAANSGTVIASGYNRAYGKYTIIDHGGGISTLYAHQSRTYVKKGDKVKRGQKIGGVGTTGYSTGNHLHFEVRRNGNPENPMKWYK